MMNRTVLAAVLLAASIHMSAQSSVSPYSMFGTGAIDTGNHGISAGMAGSVIMGQVTHSEASDYWTAKTKSVSAVTPYLDFGIQYHRSLGRYTSVTAGVTGSYRKDIAMHNTYTLYDNDTTTVSGSVKPTTTMTVPAYAGAGISYTSRTVTAGIDYVFQKWSAASSGSDLIRYKDMHKITLGISYIPNEHDVRRYWERIKYRFGASVDDSYLTAGGIADMTGP